MCFLVLQYFNLFGQEVINRDWFPEVKDKESFTLVYPIETVEVKEGLGFVCDFRVEVSERNKEVTVQYVSYKDGLDGFNFPDANMRIIREDKYFYYIDSSSDTLSMAGYSSDKSERFNLGSKKILGIINFKLGDTLVNSYNQDFFSKKTLHERRYSITDSLIYSGYGKVITFNGVTENCVQIKRIRYKNSKPDFYEYTFYKDNFSNVVLFYREYVSGNTEPVRKIEYPTLRTTKL